GRIRLDCPYRSVARTDPRWLVTTYSVRLGRPENAGTALCRSTPVPGLSRRSLGEGGAQQCIFPRRLGKSVLCPDPAAPATFRPQFSILFHFFPHPTTPPRNPKSYRDNSPHF